MEIIVVEPSFADGEAGVKCPVEHWRKGAGEHRHLLAKLRAVHRV